MQSNTDGGECHQIIFGDDQHSDGDDEAEDDVRVRLSPEVKGTPKDTGISPIITCHANNEKQPEPPLRSSEKNLTTKTAKAVERVLGGRPIVYELEKLRVNYKRNPKSRYAKNRYESHLVKVQTSVLSRLQECKEKIKNWDSGFVLKNSRLPNIDDYSDEITSEVKKQKEAQELLRQWDITVHLH